MLKNAHGQMTIFIALIFQVLFVFFAMIINVGLIVHDKINLQNSVDIAAYYAAQRQAEMLNAIAHHNYQIRQAWKLLSFRVRVLGDLGYKQHPINTDFQGSTQDVPAFGVGAGSHRPYVCVAHSLWDGGEQNLCKEYNIFIPEIPKPIVVAPFLPFNLAIALDVGNLRERAGTDCEARAINNFEIAVRWMLAYRNQVGYAKKSIQEYAKKLSAGTSDFFDIEGASTKEGAIKTLAANLTVTNRQGFSQDSFQIYNSLGVGDYKQWLNEVPTYPNIFYARLAKSGAACSGAIYAIDTRNPQELPAGYTPDREIDIARTEPPPGNIMASTFGMEKNPWMMAYVAVYAESRPRKPYLPFGEPILLRAKAFAKPFGGRIGPWYYSTWQRGSSQSSGNQNDKIDMLAPEPIDITQVQRLSPAQQESLVPNYSRYPGDRLGLRSAAALTVFKQSLLRQFRSGNSINVGFYSGIPQKSDALAYALPTSTNFSQFNNFRLELGYNGPWIRDFEAAAIAPDLFDATYYSIDPDAYNNYIRKAIQAQFTTSQEASYDQGTLLAQNRFIGVGFDSSGNERFSQMGVLNKLVPTSQNNRFFYMKKPEHLLTGWAPSGPFQYEFPEEVFGKCDAVGKIPIPGRCAVGGRVGYSVKIVSEDYLRSSDLELGGLGIKGPILNPPPE